MHHGSTSERRGWGETPWLEHLVPYCHAYWDTQELVREAVPVLPSSPSGVVEMYERGKASLFPRKLEQLRRSQIMSVTGIWTAWRAALRPDRACWPFINSYTRYR